MKRRVKAARLEADASEDSDCMVTGSEKQPMRRSKRTIKKPQQKVSERTRSARKMYSLRGQAKGRDPLSSASPAKVEPSKPESRESKRLREDYNLQNSHGDDQTPSTTEEETSPPRAKNDRGERKSKEAPVRKERADHMDPGTQKLLQSLSAWNGRWCEEELRFSVYIKYEGDMKNGKPHGKGKTTWSKMCEAWRKNHDTSEFANGRFCERPFDYVGDFRDGCYHGYGEATFKCREGFSAEPWSGEWKDGQPVVRWPSPPRARNRDRKRPREDLEEDEELVSDAARALDMEEGEGEPTEEIKEVEEGGDEDDEGEEEDEDEAMEDDSILNAAGQETRMEQAEAIGALGGLGGGEMSGGELEGACGEEAEPQQEEGTAREGGKEGQGEGARAAERGRDAKRQRCGVPPWGGFHFRALGGSVGWGAGAYGASDPVRWPLTGSWKVWGGEGGGSRQGEGAAGAGARPEGVRVGVKGLGDAAEEQGSKESEDLRGVSSGGEAAERESFAFGGIGWGGCRWGEGLMARGDPCRWHVSK